MNHATTNRKATPMSPQRHLSVVPEPTAPQRAEPLDRNQAITAIRAALKRRSGKTWSVRGGQGTSWGWITICAPPRRLVDHAMSAADAAELAQLLGLDQAHDQGVTVPASSQYRQEYVDRAEGRQPDVLGTPYWD